ncbi:MAG: 50S ribosomal protein L9 [Chloroflexota bacterium]|nr:50S ribosomal protein L9 [Chloroflexota bacterium]
MKILLMRDVPNLGEEGEVKTVADGYARNYLIPQGMAVLATEGVLKQARLRQQIEARREAHRQQEMQRLAATLRELSLTFRMRAGENEQLYGSITNGDIAEKLEEQIGRAIDRRKIELESPIRRLGSYRVLIRLGSDLTPHIGVVVQRQEE